MLPLTAALDAGAPYICAGDAAPGYVDVDMLLIGAECDALRAECPLLNFGFRLGSYTSVRSAGVRGPTVLRMLKSGASFGEAGTVGNSSSRALE